MKIPRKSHENPRKEEPFSSTPHDPGAIRSPLQIIRQLRRGDLKDLGWGPQWCERWFINHEITPINYSYIYHKALLSC